MNEDKDDGEEVANKGSSDDNPYEVNNLMHNIIMHGEEVALGLAILS